MTPVPITPPTWGFLGDVAVDHGLNFARFLTAGIKCGLFIDEGSKDLTVEVKEDLPVVMYIGDTIPYDLELKSESDDRSASPRQRRKAKAPQAPPEGGWNWEERYR